MRKCTLHLFGCQEDGSSSTILLALLCVFSHSIALNNERSHDPPAGLDGMNLPGLNPMVIYLVSLFYSQMPQNSTRYFFFSSKILLFLLVLTFICSKICTEQPVPGQICQTGVPARLVCPTKSGVEVIHPGPARGQRVLPSQQGDPLQGGHCRAEGGQPVPCKSWRYQGSRGRGGVRNALST